MGYRDEVMADAPAAYFRLGERSGSAAVDVVGGTAGAYAGGFSPTSGLLAADGDGAVALDGLSGLVRVAHRASLNVADSFTYELWVTLLSVGIHGFIDKGSGAAIMRTDATNRVLLRRNSVGDIVLSTVALAVGQRYHVVGTKAGAASSRLYVNGENVSGAVTNQTCANTATELDVGASDGGTSDFLNGVMDEAAVYAAPLTQARVQAHYAAGAGAVVGGFLRLPDGRLALTSSAPVGEPRAGFAVSATGALAATSAGGSWTGGFLRSSAGALCVAVDAAGSMRGGFLRDATGALCVTGTGPFAMDRGFLRDSAGRLAVQFA